MMNRGPGQADPGYDQVMQMIADSLGDIGVDAPEVASGYDGEMGGVPEWFAPHQENGLLSLPAPGLDVPMSMGAPGMPALPVDAAAGPASPMGAPPQMPGPPMGMAPPEMGMGMPPGAPMGGGGVGGAGMDIPPPMGPPGGGPPMRPPGAPTPGAEAELPPWLRQGG